MSSTSCYFATARQINNVKCKAFRCSNYLIKRVLISASGDVFGESFWPTRTGRKSKANVQALTYCEFEVLSHESLNEIMILFPDYWDIWAEKLKISYELSSKTALFVSFQCDLFLYDF